MSRQELRQPLKSAMSSSSKFSDTSSHSNQLVLDNVPAGILQQLQQLAERNGTSASHEAVRI
ncbi:MAG: hypothetical protein ACO3PN_06260, partial [Chthoniobacterales bacterium]